MPHFLLTHHRICAWVFPLDLPLWLPNSWTNCLRHSPCRAAVQKVPRKNSLSYLRKVWNQADTCGKQWLFLGDLQYQSKYLSNAKTNCRPPNHSPFRFIKSIVGWTNATLLPLVKQRTWRLHLQFHQSEFSVRSSFMVFKERALALRVVSSLRAFTLSCKVLYDASWINNLIAGALRCDLQELSLFLFDTGTLSELPSCMFRCHIPL